MHYKNSITFPKLTSHRVVHFFNFRHYINVSVIAPSLWHVKINTHWQWRITERQGCVMGKSTKYLNQISCLRFQLFHLIAVSSWTNYHAIWFFCFLIYEMETIVVFTSQSYWELIYVNCLGQHQRTGSTQSIIFVYLYNLCTWSHIFAFQVLHLYNLKILGVFQFR